MERGHIPFAIPERCEKQDTGGPYQFPRKKNGQNKNTLQYINIIFFIVCTINIFCTCECYANKKCCA